MKNWGVYTISIALVIGALVAGCSTSTTEHYVSPRIEGSAQEINLDAVQKAFWDTKGKDFNEWMAAFEKQVNEIYEGKEIVSIDATRKDNKLVVTGYIDKVKKEGYQPGDDKLFSIEQTGEAADNQMPYRVAGNDGRTYYEGHHSLLDNPILQMLIISHMMHGWGGGYYTPAPHYVVLQQSRDVFRSSPEYQTTKSANSSFFSRFKTNSNGGLTSTTNSADLARRHRHQSAAYLVVHRVRQARRHPVLVRHQSGADGDLHRQALVLSDRQAAAGAGGGVNSCNTFSMLVTSVVRPWWCSLCASPM